MNLWFRLLALLLRARFRPRLRAPHDISRLRFRVWFNDLDINGHVNNGRYWTIFDLGRVDLVLRTGLGRVALKRKWAPMVGAGAIRFRRELRLFQPFVLETRLLGWTESRLIMEQRILTVEDDIVATRAVILAGFYDRRERRFVTVDEVFSSVGVQDAVSPPLDGPAKALLRLDAALKEEPETAARVVPLLASHTL